MTIQDDIIDSIGLFTSQSVAMVNKSNRSVVFVLFKLKVHELGSSATNVSGESMIILPRVGRQSTLSNVPMDPLTELSCNNKVNRMSDLPFDHDCKMYFIYYCVNI